MIAPALEHALQEALGDAVVFEAPLSRHTSLRIGGPADALATPASREQLADLLRICVEHEVPHLPLGRGFNCLASDYGVEGVVIKLDAFRSLERTGENSLQAEAGVTHASVTRFCSEHGLSGLEFAAGIPGVVGGWIPMNAGIGVREMKDVVREIEILVPGETETRRLPRQDLHFEYRALRGLPTGSILVSASFGVSQATPESVRAEVDRLLAQRADSQPLNVPSCGSVFKNPEGDHAGRLIEAAGLKGLQLGGAQISPVHANFIANTGGATADDVLQLMKQAQETVEKETGIRLEPEVRVLGRPAPTEGSE